LENKGIFHEKNANTKPQAVLEDFFLFVPKRVNLLKGLASLFFP
jgi:hypothetical protein